MTAYLSFTHYDLLNPPRWVGLANYRYLFGTDPQIWPAVDEHALVDRASPCRCRCSSRSASRVMLTRAKAGVGFFRTVFYLPALVPPVAATLGFVYLLNPATGPGEHDPRRSSASRARSGSTTPAWSKPSLVMLGLWGIGNTMIIFLAAVLDVPRHLYESARARRRRGVPRLRWVTLPTISPVILFAVVLGVIQALQYFTQAYVAASVAAGQASQGGAGEHPRARVPRGLDALLPDPPLLQRLPLLQHGLRVGDGDAAARRRVRRHGLIIRNSRRWVHYQGARGERRDARAARRGAPRVATVPPAIVRRRRFLIAIADHSLLIVVAIAFLAPVVFIALTSLMTNDQALSAKLWPARSGGSNYVDVFSSAPLWRWALNSFIYASLATLGLLVSSIPVAYAFARLRWRGRDALFLVVLVALMLPPQVTVVPLYVMWAKLDLVGDAVAADHPELVRRRVRDLPAPAVLPDDPGGVPRRGARRRLRRVPHPDDGRAAPRQAGDRGRRAVLGPLHLERLLPAAPLRRREPGQLGRLDRPLAVPEPAPGAVEPDDGGDPARHAARRRSSSSSPRRRSSRA